MNRLNWAMRTSHLESLEHRRLLAADLVVELDAFELESAGEEVSRTIRISNNGDVDAVDVVIQAQLSDQLADATWSRSNALAELLHSVEPEPELLQTIRASSDVSWRRNQVLGDVNGDDHIDFGVLVEDSDDFNDDFVVVFGRDETVNVDEIPRTSGNVESPLGVHFSETDWWRRPEAIGDINGDQIQDLALRDRVVFGSQDLGSSGAISSANIGDFGFRVVGESGVWLRGIGDVNDDGFDDFTAGNAVVFGGPDIGLDGDISVAADATSPNVFRFEQFGWFGSAGDINGDGFNEFGSGLNVVSGQGTGPNGDPAITLLEPTLRDGWGGEANPIDAGDVNGDGIDDLVYFLYGPITDGTASDKDSSYVKSGVNIVFGHPDIFDGESINVAADGLTIEIGTHYFDRPDPFAEDRNGDGLADIVFSVTGKEYVIFGSPEMKSMSFGYDDIRPFDGFNGFATIDVRHQDRQSERVTRFDGVDYSFATDWDHRGPGEIVNVVRFQSPNAWRVPSERSGSGSGDVTEQLTIPAGESVVYEVSGTLKDDAAPSILITASANESRDSQALTFDSLGTLNAGENSAPSVVDLRAELSHTGVITGQTASFEVAIENDGPTIAREVAIDSSLLDSLKDPSWTLTTKKLFPETEGWSSDFGVDRLGFVVGFGEGSDFSYVGGLNTFLGDDYLPIGDVNADGIDDFRLKRRIAFGSRESDATGFSGFSTVNFDTGSFGLSSVTPLGDVNGDGIDDVEVASWNWRDSSYRYAVVHGREGLANTEVQIMPSEWTAESVARRFQLGQFVTQGGQTVDLVQEDGNVVRLGDLNNDGHDDYAATYSEDRDRFVRILFGQEAPFESPLDLRDETAVEIPDRAWLVNIRDQDEDLNGDGIADFVFTFRNRIDPQQSISVVLGSETLRDEPIVFENIRSSASSQGVGFGDFNNDGWIDLASAEDAIYVYFLGEGLEVLGRQRVTDPFINPTELPLPILSAADVNGDGVDDLLIGDPYHEPYVEQGPSGRAYVMFGRDATDLSGTQGFDSTFDIAPGERILLRIEGTVTDATLDQVAELRVNPPDDQFELNPFNNAVRIESPNAVMATEEIFAIDIDGSGKVDFADFLAISVNFGKSNATRSDGDLDGDDEVGFGDFLLVNKWFGASVL